jgi:hypothetical protein
MTDIRHRILPSNGIRIHVAECGRARLCCSCTASRNPGIPGVTSCPRSLRRATAPWPWTCAGMAVPPSRRRSPITGW